MIKSPRLRRFLCYFRFSIYMDKLFLNKKLVLAYKRYVYILKDLDYYLKKSNNQGIRNLREFLFREVNLEKISKFFK